MNARWRTGLLLLMLGGLTTCHPKAADAVLPQVAHIQLVASDTRLVRFVEDSLHNTIAFQLTFYDANKSVITPPGDPPVSGQRPAYQW